MTPVGALYIEGVKGAFNAFNVQCSDDRPGVHPAVQHTHAAVIFLIFHSTADD